MDISIYFEPVSYEEINFFENPDNGRLGDIIQTTGELEEINNLSSFDIAILGIKEDRNAVNNTGCDEAPHEIRKYLYHLFSGIYTPKIIDLGDIKKGQKISDTYFALRSTVTELLRSNVIPILIGGSQDLTYPLYQAYETLERIINMVSIDNSFDLAKSDDHFDSKSFLSKIILHKPNFLFNYANIGYQTYFVARHAVILMENLFFDIHRLGNIRNNLEEAEPIIRNADLVTFDISAVRQTDAPGNGNASPNGFFGEEVCQLTRYAGMSDKVSSVGFFETNPRIDNKGQTAHLVAQMIWYFIDGFYNRQNDFPLQNKDGFVKYIVNIQDLSEDVVFYKNNKTNRWWMEIPLTEKKHSIYERHLMVPCSYNDYQTACKNNFPDRWWKTYQKLM